MSHELQNQSIKLLSNPRKYLLNSLEPKIYSYIWWGQWGWSKAFQNSSLLAETNPRLSSLLTLVSSLLTLIERGTFLLQSDTRPATCLPPCDGAGGVISTKYCHPAWPPATSPPPSGVAGEPAVPAGWLLTYPHPYNSPGAPPPPWASVARGEGLRAVKSTRQKQQPAAIAADFTALYDWCLASGLKARVVFSHAAGRQTLTISCNFPAPAETTAAAGKRRCRHRCHQGTVEPPSLHRMFQLRQHLLPPPPQLLQCRP